jgi:hypothetical protein
MAALAKLWTWIGQTFVPLAVAWAVYARGGLPGEHIEEGVLITRGYWALLVTLVVGNGLSLVGALYVREARRTKAKFSSRRILCSERQEEAASFRGGRR